MQCPASYPGRPAIRPDHRACPLHGRSGEDIPVQVEAVDRWIVSTYPSFLQESTGFRCSGIPASAGMTARLLGDCRVAVINHHLRCAPTYQTPDSRNVLPNGGYCEPKAWQSPCNLWELPLVWRQPPISFLAVPHHTPGVADFGTIVLK